MSGNRNIFDRVCDAVNALPAWCVAAAIVALGAGLRILCYLRDPVISRDGIGYLAEAAKMLSGNHISSDCPFWVVLLSEGIRRGFSAEAFGITLSLVCGSLIPLAAIWSAWKILDSRRGALFCGALLAFNPVIIKLSCEIQRENPYLLFMILFCGTCYIYSRNRNPFYGCLSGLLLSWCVLSRWEGLEMLAISVLWFAVIAVKEKKAEPFIVKSLILSAAFIMFFFLFFFCQSREGLYEFMVNSFNIVGDQVKRFI